MGSTVVMGGFFDELFIAYQVGRGATLDWRFLTRPFFGRNEDGMERVGLGFSL